MWTLFPSTVGRKRKWSYCGDVTGVSLKFAGQVSHLGAGFLNRGPRQPLGATERLSRGHEQRFLLTSSAVILQNPSVTILIIRQLKGEGGHKPRKVENHCLGVLFHASPKDDTDTQRQVKLLYCAANKLRVALAQCFTAVENTLFHAHAIYACQVWCWNFTVYPYRIFALHHQ